MDQFHKATFARIPSEKQRRILDAGISEFAAKGFPGANINVIARKAGISIGSMYKYFGSKEGTLFLTIIEQAHGLLGRGPGRDRPVCPATFSKRSRKMVRAAQNYARQYPELHQIYLDMTSEGLSHMSRKLSGKMETVSVEFLRKDGPGGHGAGRDRQSAKTPLDRPVYR